MNPIMQTLDASKRLLGFRLAELAHRSGFSIPNIDDAEGKEESFLHDMLHTLPVELYRFGADIYLNDFWSRLRIVFEPRW